MIFLIYFLKLIVISGILSGYYFLFLRNQSFHFFNRFFLIGIIILSIGLPLVFLPLLDLAGIRTQTSEKGLFSVIKIWDWEDAITIRPGMNSPINFVSWQIFASALYLMGSLIPSYRFISSIFYIRKISRQNHYEKIGDIKVFSTVEPDTPFSFFNQIFWNGEWDISTEKGHQILRHELYHVKEKHSLDIILMELATILFWFNPFFYLVKNESKATHEFLADQYAISGYDKFKYAELLVLQSMMLKHANIHNYFFQNQIKRRITMLTQFKNVSFPFLRKLMILPLLVILFCTCTRNQKNNIVRPEYDKIFTKVEIESEFPGGQAAWEEYLYKNLHYPVWAINKEIQGDVIVQFIVDKEGNVSEVEALDGPKELRDEAVRVFKKSGKWTPAVQNGHQVTSYKKQPIKFRLERQF